MDQLKGSLQKLLGRTGPPGRHAREEQNQSGDNDERREQGLTAVRDEQYDSRENDSRRNGGDREVGQRRDDRKFGDERGFGENPARREQDQLGERGEQDSRRGPSMSGADAYGPVLEVFSRHLCPVGHSSVSGWTESRLRQPAAAGQHRARGRPARRRRMAA